MLAIVAIVVAVWFYHAAGNAAKENVWQWVAIGVGSFYASGIVWVYLILPQFLERRAHSSTMAVAIEVSGILVGLLVAALIRAKGLPRQASGS